MKSIAFVGMAEGWQNAPIYDKNFDLWTCNAFCKEIDNKRIKVCFDMHDWEAADYYPVWYKYLQQKLPFPVIRPYKTEKVPNCEVFPLKEAKKLFPDHAFASTLSYVIAYATIKGVKDLYMWGINTSEFIKDDPRMGYSFYYCMGIARVLGTKVHIVGYQVPDALPLYGYVKYSYKDSYRDLMAVYGNENYVIKDGADDEYKAKNRADDIA